MSLSVNTNTSALTVQRSLYNASKGLETSMTRLSTGFRINSAKDDAAGLQISNRLTSQISGTRQAVSNAHNALSIAQTAEGALQESTNILQRMRVLAVQSSNGSNSTEDRKSLNEEFESLSAELTRISKTTTFGGGSSGLKLLDGTAGANGTLTFQVGSNANETVSFTLGDMGAGALKGTSSLATGQGTVAITSGTVATSGTLTINKTAVNIAAGASAKDIASSINSNITGVTATVDDTGHLVLSSGSDIDVTTGAGSNDLATTLGLTNTTATKTDSTVQDLSIDTTLNSQKSIQVLDNALKMVDSQRSSLGAFQNRIDSTISNLQNIGDNTSAARSVIRDTDYARETAEMTKQQVLQSASSSVLAQANQLPSMVLKLLG